MNRQNCIIGLAGLVLVAALPAWGAFPEKGQTHRTPPREAIVACQGKSEGDAVTFVTPRGDTLNGVCHQMGGQLAAVPDRRPPRSDGEQNSGEQGPGR